VAGQIALMTVLALAPDFWRWTAPARDVWRGAGALLILAGVGLGGRAMLELGPNLTSLPYPRREGWLVRTGLYRRVRHPIYGGLIIAAFGWALWRVSALHVLLAAVLTLYITAKSNYEERHLLARFPEYAVYRQTTRRFIPGVF
jgi:protein-S-isoprenylcysteine O-methyltransferase Ste14